MCFQVPASPCDASVPSWKVNVGDVERSHKGFSVPDSDLTSFFTEFLLLSS